MEDTERGAWRLGELVVSSERAGAPSHANEHDTVTRLFVRRATDQTCRENPQAVIVPKTNNALPPQAMLGVVGYCYAKEKYGADEIEQELLHDPIVRKMCGLDVPDAKTIRRFRRLNRSAVLKILERVFRVRRRRAKNHLLGVPCPPANAPLAELEADDSGQTTILYARHQAEDRLENAIISDCTDIE